MRRKRLIYFLFKRGGTNMETIPAFKKPKRGYCPRCNSEESLKSVIFHDKKGDYYSCFRCQNCFQYCYIVLNHT